LILFSNLKLEIVYLNEETKTKIFTPENKTVKIGRQKDNDIYLENYAYSRVHTTFYYNFQESAWFIMDGTDGKPSTNGTW
jgi:pSer/pThr/pTyr-binding forkhead associated (FHA) protein